MEGAARPVQPTLLLEHDALGDDADEVGGFTDAANVILGDASHGRLRSPLGGHEQPLEVADGETVGHARHVVDDGLRQRLS